MLNIADLPLATRGASASDLLALLTAQGEARRDWVVPVAKMRTVHGRLVIADAMEAVLDENGVTSPETDLAMTQTMVGQIAGRLGIPTQYLRRLHTLGTIDEDREMLDLFDANANTWLRHLARTGAPNVMVRAFVDDEGRGIARALVSDQYAAIDNLELFGAVIKGVSEAGLDPQRLQLDGDITESQMFVRIVHPDLAVPGGDMLKGYTYRGRTAAEFPDVFGGLLLRNSETGNGAASLTPRMVVQVCTNGMVQVRERKRVTHIGGRLDAGSINWSAATQRRALDLATSMTADVVRTTMTPTYLEAVIREMTAEAGIPIPPQEAEKVVTTVARGLGWADQEAKSILTELLMGGQLSSGGVMNAVTAVAQNLPDADRAAELEDQAREALTLASRAAAGLVPAA